MIHRYILLIQSNNLLSEKKQVIKLYSVIFFFFCRNKYTQVLREALSTLNVNHREGTLQRVAIPGSFVAVVLSSLKSHQARLTLSAQFVSVIACSSLKKHINTQIYCLQLKCSPTQLLLSKPHGVLTPQEGTFPKKVKLPNNLL